METFCSTIKALIFCFGYFSLPPHGDEILQFRVDTPTAEYRTAPEIFIGYEMVASETSFEVIAQQHAISNMPIVGVYNQTSRHIEGYIAVRFAEKPVEIPNLPDEK